MGSWKVVTAQSTHTLTMLPLLLLSALLAAASGQAALEPYMLGKFELESSNGFEDFMTEIGVGFLTRKVACALTPVATNSLLPNGQIKIDTHSTFKRYEVQYCHCFKSSSITFSLNKPFRETTSDGRKVVTTAVLQGNRLIKTQLNPVDKSLNVVETREFSPDGRKMTLIHTMPSKPSIRSVRVDKRIN